MLVALWVIAQTTQATEQWLESLFGDLYKQVVFYLGYVLESAAGALKKTTKAQDPPESLAVVVVFLFLICFSSPTKVGI